MFSSGISCVCFFLFSLWMMLVVWLLVISLSRVVVCVGGSVVISLLLWCSFGVFSIFIVCGNGSVVSVFVVWVSFSVLRNFIVLVVL